MTEKTTPASRTSVDPRPPLARLAFVLGVVSVLIYFGTSEGIHNFVAFLIDIVAKVTGRRS